MREEKHEGFPAWLRARRPLCGLALFEAAGLCGETNFDTACEQSVTQSQEDDLFASRKALPEMVKSVPAATQAVGRPEEEQPAVPTPPVAAVNGVSIERVIAIGRRLEADGLGRPLSIPADLLPRHIAILGGSGSGKTVLLRRIIEEAALLGIPAIVLDTNNDLVLLGRAWPQLPNDFTKADAAKAAVYAQTIEVVIWTPGLTSGRPLILSVLPDFAALGDDPDERTKAVEMAKATLLPALHRDRQAQSRRAGRRAQKFR